MDTTTYNILAADIGGTSARFAHFTGHDPQTLAMRDSVWLETGKSSSFGELLEMLAQSDLDLAPGDADMVSLALAGPVSGGVRSYPPNIAWDLDLTNAGQEYGFARFTLINDFAAQAFACRSPAVDGARVILAGQAAPEETVAVIGAGTGLGMAALIPDGAGGWAAMPSEGGHQVFAFCGGEEFEFQRFMRRELSREHIIGDLVVSGLGLSMVHRFLTGQELSPAETAAVLDKHPESLAMFARFFGRACRQWALATLAQGGLYIAGGVAARNPGLVDNAHCTTEFLASETHGKLLSRIPLYLNANQDSGLFGAAMSGVQALKRA